MDVRASGKRFAARLLVPRLYESDVRPSYNTYVSKIQIRRIIGRHFGQKRYTCFSSHRNILERASTRISWLRSRHHRNGYCFSTPALNWITCWCVLSLRRLGLPNRSILSLCQRNQRQNQRQKKSSSRNRYGQSWVFR